MDLSSIPLFSMLRGRLGYLSERQRLIAENVANADTAGYTPKDLKAFEFQAQVAAARGPGPVSAAVGMATSNPKHMAAPGARPGLGGAYKAKRTADSETTLDGNSVVLEEEMMKMTQARLDYDAAISFYQKSMNLLRLASRAPGRG